MGQRLADPYAVLGVAPDATAQQIRQAYLHLAKRYHPDVHADAGSVERMRRINRAWEILSDPAERQRHDADRSRQGPASRGHWAPAPRQAAPAPQPTWSPPRYARSPRYTEYSDGGVSWGGLLIALPLALLGLAGVLSGVLPLPLLALVFIWVIRLSVAAAD